MIDYFQFRGEFIKGDIIIFISRIINFIGLIFFIAMIVKISFFSSTPMNVKKTLRLCVLISGIFWNGSYFFPKCRDPGEQTECKTSGNSIGTTCLVQGIIEYIGINGYFAFSYYSLTFSIIGFLYLDILNRREKLFKYILPGILIGFHVVILPIILSIPLSDQFCISSFYRAYLKYGKEAGCFIRAPMYFYFIAYIYFQIKFSSAFFKSNDSEIQRIAVRNHLLCEFIPMGLLLIGEFLIFRLVFDPLGEVFHILGKYSLIMYILFPKFFISKAEKAIRETLKENEMTTEFIKGGNEDDVYY